MKQNKQFFRRLLAVAFWLAVWQAAAMAIGQEVFLVSPVQALRTLVQLLPRADFWQRVGFSSGRILLGFVLGAVVSVVLAAAAWVLFTQVFLLTQAKGSSMFPAVKDGDLLICYRLQKTYAKNDVVVYTQGGKLRVGRILGREGDLVALDDSGTLVVNGAVQSGEILYPTYAKDALEYPYTVPEGCVFVLGDYRTQSEDSRDFGPVPLEDVQAKVITLLRRRSL